VEARYDEPLGEGYDLVLFSYALSMFNPGWEAALRTAHRELGPKGTLAVVDFHDSPVRWFESWMKMNHVSMEQHLLPELKRQFEPLDARVHQAYFGLWRYVTFLGNPRIV
jgi:S-adenosylmethionine-diacylgycerolhomoserine-N-methlytransferase